MYTEAEIRGLVAQELGAIVGPADIDMLTEALVEFARDVTLMEREACAKIIEEMSMSDVLLATGEMTAPERRAVRAVLPWLANRIRNRSKA